jgi:UDP-3-O-[3-hydroxymyristoyl] glucosamine N-acyltransferase
MSEPAIAYPKTPARVHGMKLSALIHRLHLLHPPDPDRWKRHPNGKGWVESTAQVDRTAYVGPSAVVLERAQVLQNARIRGNTIVDGAAIVAGRVIVEGNSKVREMAVLTGDARVSGQSWIGGNAAMTTGVHKDVSLRPWTRGAIRTRNKTAESLHLS